MSITGVGLARGALQEKRLDSSSLARSRGAF